MINKSKENNFGIKTLSKCLVINFKYLYFVLSLYNINKILKVDKNFS